MTVIPEVPATTIHVVANIEPHYCAIKFDCPYGEIGVQQVIQRAYKYLMAQCEEEDGMELASSDCYLHYITDQAQAFNPNIAEKESSRSVAARLGVSDRFAFDPRHMHNCAYAWYRTMGHHISSKRFEPSATLSSVFRDPPDVALYFVASVVIDSKHYFPFFVPKDRDNIVRRMNYIKVMKDDLHHRMEEDGVSPPCVASQDLDKYDCAQASHTPIAMGYHPCEMCGPHPALFCPPFAYAYNTMEEFEAARDKFELPEDKSINMGSWVRKFWDACGLLTKSEHHLGDDLEDLLLKFISDDACKRHAMYTDDRGTAFGLDWAVECDTAHGLPGIYVAVEIKKSPLTGGDPAMQVAHVYQRMLALDRFQRICQVSCCPCLIISIQGDLVWVSMAYFTDQVYCTDLFVVSLQRTQFRDSHVEQLVPRFAIIRETIKQLRAWYANIHVGSLLPHIPCLFPNQSAFDRSVPGLVFIEKVPAAHPSHCMYKGVIASENVDKPRPRPVYIKFVQSKYGEKSHRLLAGEEYAPRLYFCEKVIRNLLMVVMADLEGHCLSTVPSRADLKLVEKYIKPAVALLHANNLGHGDLRPPNIVIRKDRAFVIDFDWAGPAKEDNIEEDMEKEKEYARYPSQLNSMIAWPEDPKEMEGRPIQKAHDNFMLHKILSYYDRANSRDTSSKTSRGDSDGGSDGDGDGGQQLKTKRQRN